MHHLTPKGYGIGRQRVVGIPLLLILLGCSSHLLFAQANTYLPIGLPSYNAVSILEHLKTPRGQYTGIPEISVPITAATGRKLSLPVALHYNAGGVRVGTLASWVGLNWSLDAGGVVIRVPIGESDVYSSANNGGTQGRTGAESDLFYFQIGGVSGKFIVHAVNQTLLFSTIPQSNLRIRAIIPDGSNRSISGFVIFDDASNQYHFMRPERTRLRVAGVERAAETNAWYLTKVVPGTYGDEITLEYESYGDSTSPYHFVAHSALSVTPGDRFYTQAAVGQYAQAPTVGSGNSASTCTGCGTSASQTNLTTVEMRLVDGARLRQINCTNGFVRFVAYTTPREDLAIDRPLRYIEVYSRYSGEDLLPVGQERLISRHELIYSYFSAACSPATSEKRLRLDRIKHWHNGLWNTPAAPTESIDTWFTYDDSQCLPLRSTMAQDMWGYWNGASPAPTTLAPGLSTSNRSVASNMGTRRVGALLSTHSQAGAVTRYTYQGHQAEGGIAVGGLRVYEVEVQPNGVAGAADNIVRQYIYTTSGRTGVASRDTVSGVVHGASGYPGGQETGFSQQVYEVTSILSGCMNAPRNSRLACGRWLRGTFTRKDLIQESHIEYRAVGENMGRWGVNGRTLTRYLTQHHSGHADAGQASYRGAIATQRDWRRGAVLRVDALDMADTNNPKPVSRSTMRYTFLTASGNGFTYLAPSYSSAQTYTVNLLPYALTASYTVECGWLFSHESQSDSWAQDGSTIPFTTTTYNTYDRGLKLLREQEQTGDGTERIGSYFRYVADMAVPNANNNPTTIDGGYLLPSGIDSTSLALAALKLSGRYTVPLETYTFRRSAPNATRMITGAALSVYRLHPIQQIGGPVRQVVLPFRTFGARMAQPLPFDTTTFPMPRVNAGGALVAANSYGYHLHAPEHRTEGIQWHYNSFGQPTRSSNRIGMRNDTRYGYNSTVPIATVSNGTFAAPLLSSPASASVCDAEQPLVVGSPATSADGWALYANASRTTQFAHTGKYAVGVSPTAAGWHGVVYRELHPEDMHAVYVLTAWARTTGTGGRFSLRATLPNSHNPAPACTTGGGSYHQEDAEIPNTNGQWQQVFVRLDLGRAKGGCFANGPVHLLAFASMYNPSTPTPIYFDDIRLHKLDATMQTMTYEPFVGPTSSSDALNNCAYTEYDDLGRVILLRDKDRNIVKQTIYKVKQ